MKSLSEILETKIKEKRLVNKYSFLISQKKSDLNRKIATLAGTAELKSEQER